MSWALKGNIKGSTGPTGPAVPLSELAKYVKKNGDTMTGSLRGSTEPFVIGFASTSEVRLGARYAEWVVPDTGTFRVSDDNISISASSSGSPAGHSQILDLNGIRLISTNAAGVETVLLNVTQAGATLTVPLTGPAPTAVDHAARVRELNNVKSQFKGIVNSATTFAAFKTAIAAWVV